MDLSRRGFLAAGAITAVAAAAKVSAQTTTSSESLASVGTGKPFQMLYATHFGLFDKTVGKDPIDELKYMHDQGFRALEDNGMMGRPRELQDKIAAEMERLGMTMGVFVANADFKNQSFVKKDAETRAMLVEKMKQAVELSKRIRAKWTTVVLDQYNQGVDWGYQTANAIDNLRACAEVCEPAGLIMVLEPLNKHNHPGLFLSCASQAYAICRAVNSPSCKILYDMYHEQISTGNLIPNINACWDEIAYLQIGDNPGRKEPGTGEVNYRNIFKHLHQKGYKGVLGMEHGKAQDTKEGEAAVIAAYRACDNF